MEMSAYDHYPCKITAARTAQEDGADGGRERGHGARVKGRMPHPCYLGLSRLDYPLAKTGEAVNSGAESAVHLDR